MFKLIYFSWEVSGTSWINFIFPSFGEEHSTYGGFTFLWG